MLAPRLGACARVCAHAEVAELLGAFPNQARALVACSIGSRCRPCCVALHRSNNGRHQPPNVRSTLVMLVVRRQANPLPSTRDMLTLDFLSLRNPRTSAAHPEPYVCVSNHGRVRSCRVMGQIACKHVWMRSQRLRTTHTCSHLPCENNRLVRCLCWYTSLGYRSIAGAPFRSTAGTLLVGVWPLTRARSVLF